MPRKKIKIGIPFGEQPIKQINKVISIKELISNLTIVKNNIKQNQPTQQY